MGQKSRHKAKNTAKKVPKHNRKGKKSTDVVNGDEEFKTLKNPDYKKDSYYFDDEDDFHSSKNKISIDDDGENSDSDISHEEVLALSSGSEDEAIAEYEERLRKLNVNRLAYERDSDVSDGEESADEENEEKGKSTSWGKKREAFYGADSLDNRRIDFSGDELDAQLLEEEEAKAMQARLAEQLDEEDFDLDLFVNKDAAAAEDVTQADVGNDVITVQQNLSDMSKDEKLELLKKDSPELLVLLADCKQKLKELLKRYLPIFQLVQSGTLPQSSGSDYIRTKVQLLMNYCVNVSFYLVLKARRTPVHDHPIIKRLIQYRNLMKQMQDADKLMADEVKVTLKSIKEGKLISNKATLTSPEKPAKRQKTLHRTSATLKTTKALTQSGAIKEKKKVVKEPAQLDLKAEPVGGRTWGRKRALQKDDARLTTSGEKQALEYYEMMKSTKTNTDDKSRDVNTDKDRRKKTANKPTPEVNDKTKKKRKVVDSDEQTAKRKRPAPDEHAEPANGRRVKLEQEKKAAVERAINYYRLLDGKMVPPEASAKSRDVNTASSGLSEVQNQDGVGGGSDSDYDDSDVEEKRGITFEMAKNKGLMPKRKKEQRNPRVKHKLKYRKAKIRRKGQVQQVRSQVQPYGGELSGIRAGVVKSTRFK